MLEIINKTYYGNTIADWLIAAVLIGLSIIIGRILLWFSSNTLKKLSKKTETKLDDILVDMIEEPLIMIGILIGFKYSITTLYISPNILLIINNLLYILVVFNIAWLINRTIDALIEQYIIPITEKSETSLDDAVLPIIRTCIQFFIWIIAIIVGLNNAGYNLGTVLAGMGIGGIAVAMASRETITNILGGLTIVIARPFKVDDRIRVNGIDGWVKIIKLNYTRVIDFYGRAHIIPNRIFIDNIIENVDNETAYYEVEKLKLRHDTNSSQIEKAIDILKNLILKNELFENNHWITFDKIGDYSFDIEFWYAIKKWRISDKPKYSDWYQKKSFAKILVIKN